MIYPLLEISAFLAPPWCSSDYHFWLWSDLLLHSFLWNFYTLVSKHLLSKMMKKRNIAWVKSSVLSKINSGSCSDLTQMKLGYTIQTMLCQFLHLFLKLNKTTSSIPYLLSCVISGYLCLQKQMTMRLVTTELVKVHFTYIFWCCIFWLKDACDLFLL